jgi:hypothetical protein
VSRLTAPCTTREHAVEHYRPQILESTDSRSKRECKGIRHEAVGMRTSLACIGLDTRDFSDFPSYREEEGLMNVNIVVQKAGK